MKMRRKITSLILTVLLVICGALPAQAAVSDTGFADVAANDWYAEAVTYCRENGLMSGTGSNNFSPNSNMSRAMLATVLYRMEGEPQVNSTNPFTDVPAGQWYTGGVLWAQQNDIVSGYGDGRFGTNDPITREQIAAILWRYEGRPQVGKDAEFADAAQISSYALEAVDWARANGIVNGKGGNRFDPKGNATRAEVAAMLMNYHKLTNETPTPPDPDQGKVLVAYFSATNTTEGVAQRLAESIDADIYEIVPQVSYTSADLNYSNSNCRANLEQNDPSARPAISGSVNDMSQYDVVFIGYPIWWGQAPKIISTFLESYDFSGKAIVPFCTSGSSPIGSSATNLQGLASGVEWLEGGRFSSGVTRADLAAWVNGLGLDIE